MEMGEKKHEVFLKNLAICWELNRLVNTVLIFHSVNCHSTVHKGGDFFKVGLQNLQESAKILHL